MSQISLFSRSADLPYKSFVVDANYIQQFGKIYIKTTVSEIKSHFFLQKILQVLPNLIVSLH